MTIPNTVGVLGDERMGSGIAHAFLIMSSQVTIVERDDDSADAAHERVARTVVKSVERGVVDDVDCTMSRCEFTTNYASFAPL